MLSTTADQQPGYQGCILDHFGDAAIIAAKHGESAQSEQKHIARMLLQSYRTLNCLLSTCL